MKLGNFYESNQTTPAPYTLYKDSKGKSISRYPAQTGWQVLQIWAYPSSTCSGTSLDFKKINVQLVPTSKKVFRFRSLQAFYNGTSKLGSAPVNTSDIIAVANNTCTYINGAFTRDYLLGSGPDLYLSKFACKPINASVSNAPFSITYQILMTMKMEYDLIALDDWEMPTNTQISKFVKNHFIDQESIPYFYNYTMSVYVKRLISPSNPFYPYSGITVTGTTVVNN
jgi:hypothetical protein